MPTLAFFCSIFFYNHIINIGQRPNTIILKEVHE